MDDYLFDETAQNCQRFFVRGCVLQRFVQTLDLPTIKLRKVWMKPWQRCRFCIKRGLEVGFPLSKLVEPLLQCRSSQAVRNSIDQVGQFPSNAIELTLSCSGGKFSLEPLPIEFVVERADEFLYELRRHELLFERTKDTISDAPSSLSDPERRCDRAAYPVLLFWALAMAV